MSKTSSDSENDSIPDDDSEYNSNLGKYTIIETEIMGASDNDGDEETNISEVGPYSSEPMADEEWLQEYKKRQEEKERRLASLKDHLSGKESLSNW